MQDHCECSTLQNANLTVNPLNVNKQSNKLGYCLTPQGFKPWQKKIDSIFLSLERPKTVPEL